MNVTDFQKILGVRADGQFGPVSTAAMLARLTNPAPAPLTEMDFMRVASDLGVSVQMIKAVRKVEAPRGAFDDKGRPSILYERHIFSRATQGRWDDAHPALSATLGYGPGGYGAFSAQYGKLAAACALDPDAAFQACSWGAFQVLGSNAEDCGYDSAWDMALSLVTGEPAHLTLFARFVRANDLEDELRACRPGKPETCVPFVSRYNGPGYKRFNYHVKLAEAAAS